MKFTPHYIYHIYNQGNNRQKIFFYKNEYLVFLNLYKRLIYPNAETIAWCLMPNHFHFLVYTDERCAIEIKQGGLNLDPVTNGIRKLLSGYARIFNKNHEMSGSVFRQKTKSKCLTDIKIDPEKTATIMDYYANCFHYIHQNPFKAKLVSKLEDWEFSSFIDYTGLRIGTLCKKELAVKFCKFDQEDFIIKTNADISDEFISSFR